MRSRRGTIKRVIVFLLLGMFLNIAIAWACSLLVLDGTTATGAFGITPEQPPQWDVGVFHRPGAIRMYGWVPNEEHQALLALGPDFGMRVPRWSRFKAPPHAPSHGEIERIADDARGWPMVSLRTRFIVRADSIDSVVWTSEWIGGIPLPPHLPANSLPIWEVRALPLIPIWPNFAINTLFYALMLWLLLAAARSPTRIRRFIRIKRGRCPACAYPVGTSPVCTECGTPLPKRDRR